MQGPVDQILDFLISTLFGIYIILLLLRLIFGLVRADFFNPISQTIVQLTNPPLVLMRRFIPPLGRLDLAAVVLILLLKVVELWLRTALMGIQPGFGTIMLAAISAVLVTTIWILIVSLIVEVVLSWVQAGGGDMRGNPVARLVADVNRPILAPLRRNLPSTGAIDFSPMVALIGLYILLILARSI
ncbi:Integral membrane protein YggT, involved in response to extracytoplasmic stress (osmotic shock) [Thioalkalivibrio nitratireducens DSM 14787]|uniref:Integral membrane protein YggT, involved in response to extracytoplasmic stress (Osmotic shock) n=1 Tax=Thioalkalivibrio nitratireducens (strain DSM 14787 / UNIQEM 213 / ALEN2) TaxID=1255043 RepID=L0DUI5_THIND|nr:YggT family protein [Thioalkalivibrio nitratireducens]AGA32006.1 Integral membrane protein YggT, involved in response to extracytoplasmic stress (osmotic shock) [Thioalkalivibrio nitratireducens DSM 14787]